MPGTILGMTGGIDSATLLFRLLSEGSGVDAVFVDYGQPSKERDLASAAVVLAKAKKIFGRPVHLRTIRLASIPFDQDGLSPMTQFGTVIVSVLASIAVGSKADRIGCGARIDTTPEGFDMAANRLVQTAAPRAQVGVLWPFASKTKEDVIRQAFALGVPFRWTWSCQAKGQKHCGMCRGCKARRHGFKMAGLVDPTEYKVQ